MGGKSEVRMKYNISFIAGGGGLRDPSQLSIILCHGTKNGGGHEGNSK